MNTSLLLCVLAVLAGAYAAHAPTTRSNLSVGVVAIGDKLLHRQYLYQQALPNTVQYQDLIYRGNFTTRISAVQATEVGYSQYASAWILSGGVGARNVTLRVQSARGYGYYYLIDIWGR